MYTRRNDLQALRNIDRAPWSFRTKMELVVELVERCVTVLKNWFDRPVLATGFPRQPLGTSHIMVADLIFGGNFVVDGG